MGHSIGGASDPSVADYRATSPRFSQGGITRRRQRWVGGPGGRSFVDGSCRTRPTPPRRREFNEGEDRGAGSAPASIAWYQLL